jgi:hypothetical protein
VTGPPRWIAGVVAGMLAVLAVGVLVAPRLLHATPSRTATHTAVESLPLGVCPLSTEGLADASTSRMEAKLITFRSFVSSDPDFRWLQNPDVQRQRTTPPPRYFWVIVSSGTFDLGLIPRPMPQTGPETFHDLWIYVRADQCTAGGAIHFPIQTNTPVDSWPLDGMSANSKGWPSWFDQMPAVMHMNIR